MKKVEIGQRKTPSTVVRTENGNPVVPEFFVLQLVTMPARERKQTETFKPVVTTPVKRVKAAASPKAKVAKSATKEKKVKKEGPKKANAYMMFATANRADVLKKNPDATFGETGKLIGALWQKLKESEKADWKKK
jgi:hypothetical protein